MFGLQMVNEMQSFQREIDQLFGGCGFAPAHKSIRQPDRFSLRVVEDAYVVEAPLPGIDLEKLEINVLGRRLTLSGELVPAASGDAVTWHRQERSGGPFRQTLLLPLDVDSDKVDAEYKNGILRISLKKAASALPKKISVNAA